MQHIFSYKKYDGKKLGIRSYARKQHVLLFFLKYILYANFVFFYFFGGLIGPYPRPFQPSLVHCSACKTVGGESELIHSPVKMMMNSGFWSVMNDAPVNTVG